MTYNFKTLIICSLLVGKWLFQLRLTEQKLPKPAFVWIHECLSISLSFEMHRGCKHTLMMRNFITAACWATSLQTTEDWPHCSGPMGSSRFKIWTEGLSPPPSVSVCSSLSLTQTCTWNSSANLSGGLCPALKDTRWSVGGREIDGWEIYRFGSKQRDEQRASSQGRHQLAGRQSARDHTPPKSLPQSLNFPPLYSPLRNLCSLIVPVQPPLGSPISVGKKPCSSVPCVASMAVPWRPLSIPCTHSIAHCQIKVFRGLCSFSCTSPDKDQNGWHVCVVSGNKCTTPEG